MTKKVELKIWEVRGNREFLWYFWYSNNPIRRRPLVKARCLECWEEQIVLKENFVRWNHCNICTQKRNHKNLADFKRTHGLWQSRFYRLYYTMKGRCIGYGKLWKKYYHDKGIKCLWNTFDDFKKDMYESYLIHVSKFWEKDTTIERIDNSKDYCKENCRWATIREQKRNTTRNRFYNFNWVKLCEEDIKKLTKKTRAEVRKIYTPM